MEKTIKNILYIALGILIISLKDYVSYIFLLYLVAIGDPLSKLMEIIRIEFLSYIISLVLTVTFIPATAYMLRKISFKNSGEENLNNDTLSSIFVGVIVLSSSISMIIFGLSQREDEFLSMSLLKK